MPRLLCLVILLCALLAVPASANTRQSLTVDAPRDLLDPASRPAAFAELDSIGVRALRLVMYWRDVAPSADSATRPAFEQADPSAYRFSRYDAVVDEAVRRGWPVTLTVSGPVPKWATKARRDTLTRPSSSSFGAFMQAVGRHFGPRISTWAIWNEPNQPQFLRPQFAGGGKAASPAIYRRLFASGARALRKTGNARDTILFGETSPRGTSRVVAPLTFLRGALCLSSRYHRTKSCQAVDADGYAHHAYSTRQGPFFKPRGRNDVTIGVLSRLTTALSRAFKAKATKVRLPLYLTEFGVQSVPDRIAGVSLAQQVEYRAISERIAYDNPRVVSFSQYLLRDSDPTGKNSFGGFESGLRFSDGRAKPALAAFPLPLVARRISPRRVSLWGLVRAAGGPATATVTYADRGKSFKVLRTVQTNSRGYFTFRAGYRKGRRYNLSANGRTSVPVRAYRRP